jgi:hypothetical protein
VRANCTTPALGDRPHAVGKIERRGSVLAQRRDLVGAPRGSWGEPATDDLEQHERRQEFGQALLG